MAVIKLYSDNPTDGTDTFDTIKWYEATDSDGTGATALSSGGSDITTDIDTDTTDRIHPGFTTYTYTSGSITKYYASKWYNSSSGVVSSYSDWVLGGQDRWDEKFKEEMDDSDGDVWSSDTRNEFKKDALSAIFPDFYREVIDTSLTIQNESNDVQYIYTVPYGIFDISEVGVGTLDTTSATSTRNFKKIKSDYWTFEKNKLHLQSLSGLGNDETIRLIASRKYSYVGEVPAYLDSVAMLHMKMNAYLNLADDYPRFQTWARIQKGTKVSFENLRVHAREFERKFKEAMAGLKQNPYSSLM